MGTTTILYGYIGFHCDYGEEDSERRHNHNRMVMEELPKEGEDTKWPYFVRSMFSIVPYRYHWTLGLPQYDYSLIHFAGSYKNMSGLDREWVNCFEGFLKTLYWDTAIVHTAGVNSNGNYEWRIPYNYFENDPLNQYPPSDQWIRRCIASIREEEKEIPWEEAVL